MRVVYVVTSKGRDVYSAMTRLSVASLRMTNPEARVVVVCDLETDAAVRVSSDPLLSEVDEWKPFETPPGPAAFRNRFLKTSLRERLAGPFLYLDSDTIIRGDLSAVFQQAVDFAAVPNFSADKFSVQLTDYEANFARELDWSLGDAVYLNGGVLYVADTLGAHRLFEMWHEKWRASYEKLNNYRDQPALNSAIHESKVNYAVLPHHYNAQFWNRPAAALNATVWHYYFAMVGGGPGHLNQLIYEAKHTGRVDQRRLKRLIQTQALWHRDYWTGGEGWELVRRAVRELFETDKGGDFLDKCYSDMLYTDRHYARHITIKLLVDSYWSEEFDVYRFARWKLLRHFPFRILNPGVIKCLANGLRKKYRFNRNSVL